MNPNITKFAGVLNDYGHFYNATEKTVLQNELLKELQEHNKFLDENIALKRTIIDKMENMIPLTEKELKIARDLGWEIGE